MEFDSHYLLFYHILLIIFTAHTIYHLRLFHSIIY